MRSTSLRQWILLCAACSLLFATCTRPTAAQALSESDKAAWRQRLTTIAPNSVEGAKTAQSFLTIDGDESFGILREVWPQIPSPETRLYLMNMMQEHPRVLDVLHLGVTDPSLFVQNRALQALELYSFDNFAEDFGEYDAWRKRQVGKSLEETMRNSCRDYIAGVGKVDDALRPQRLVILQRIAYNLNGSAHAALRRKAMLESGLPDALALWVIHPSTAWTAFAVLRNLKMDEAYLRKVLVPLTDPKTETTFRRQAIGVLATPENRWAAELVLQMFAREYPDPEAENLGYALTQFGDPSVLPTLIGMLDADRSPDGQRVLGNLLNLITGNTAGPMRDNVWWHSWWTRNSRRFAPAIVSLEVPRMTLRARPPAGVPQRGPEQHQIAGDIKRTYWLISPAGPNRLTTAGAGHQLAGLAVRPPDPPGRPGAVLFAVPPAGEAAPGLLVVLPPDGNGAEAALYWQEVLHKSLKEHYYIAVATAPKWTQEQRITWLTADNIKQVKEARLSTEKFVAEIVQDVTASHTVQADRIFLHGAAESGPAVYACSLDDTSPFKGFYILSSTFKTVSLPPLSRARHRRYLIQHSVGDKAAPYVMAAAAQKLLSEQGGVAKLAPYKGSHGYLFSDPSADPIAEALAWLEGSQK